MKPVQIQIRYWHLFTFDVKILCISGEAYRLLREELSKLSWKKQPARLQNFVHFCEPIRAPDCCNLPACHRENEDKIQHTCYPSFINCSSSLPGGSHAARHIPPFWGNCSQKPGEMRRSRLTLAFVNVFRLPDGPSHVGFCVLMLFLSRRHRGEGGKTWQRFSICFLHCSVHTKCVLLRWSCQTGREGRGL